MRKINNELVSLELAKLAREVGFDEICDFCFCYDTLNEGYYTSYDDGYFQNSKLWEKHFSAPSREVLQKWLRSKNIFVVIDIDQTLEPKFAYKVTTYKNDQWDTNGNSWSDLYYNYELALEDGLKEGLKKL